MAERLKGGLLEAPQAEQLAHLGDGQVLRVGQFNGTVGVPDLGDGTDGCGLGGARCLVTEDFVIRCRGVRGIWRSAAKKDSKKIPPCCPPKTIRIPIRGLIAEIPVIRLSRD